MTFKAIIADTETTGFIEPVNIIEFAHSNEIEFPLPDIIYIKCDRFGTSQLIENGAMAAHHIINEDLVGLTSWPGFVPTETLGYLIGHGIDYDYERLGKPNLKCIDTLAFCRQIYPSESKHSLGAMIYKIYDNKAEARALVQNAHSARADVYMAWVLLQHCINIGASSMRLESWEDVYQWCEKARVPTHMWCGKHRGEPMAQVPSSYKSWALKNMTDPPIDKYQRKALGG